MAIFRNVQMSFWTDADIVDEYTPEDKFFYLYLLTNPHTNLCGCYEVSVSQMSVETGYDKKKIMSLIDKASDVHQSIRYSKETKEILILKWSKYNWTESEKFRKPLLKEIESVKNEGFKSYLMDLYKGIDTVSIPYAYGMDTTVTVTDTVTDTDTVTVTESDTDTVHEVVDYLNNKCDTKYKASSDSTKKHIKARLSEGYTFQDFVNVINKKYDDWHGTEQEKYLRPETLFGSKFEGYLNQKVNAPPKQGNKGNKFNNFHQRDYDFADLESKLLRGGSG